jgi:signal transduction histidine kinase
VAPLRRFVALWAALALITAVLLLAPDLPVAIHDARLSIAIGSVSGVIALALLQLGLLRFRILRRPIDLHTGLAFGVLAVSNLFAAWAVMPADVGDRGFDRSTAFLLLGRATAVALFLGGLASSQRRGRSARGWSNWVGLACATALGLLAITILFSASDDELPVLVGPAARALLAGGGSVADVLPDQQPPLVLANAILAGALLLSAIGYMLEGRRLHDAHLASLGAGLSVIFFGQVHALLSPSVATEYVSTGDGLRLIAYGLLLASVMSRTARDVAVSAGQTERLRLSRELHDGLSQQLAALGLRVGRLADATPLTDHRTHDLEVAQRILQSASLEARRAIASLRAERVPWSEFDQALQALGAEFSLTREVDARVWTQPSQVRLDAQLQADVLRILQEAFSNAVRHGDARRIDAVVGFDGKALRLVVHDNGTGFEPARAVPGVGLRSIAERVESRGGRLVVDSAPGEGTRIQAWFSLRVPPLHVTPA